MKEQLRVQIIGSYIDHMDVPLKDVGIITESIISGCSPLAMVGETDSKYADRFSENVDIPLPDLLNIRKNLVNMLSHSTENYEIKAFDNKSSLFRNMINKMDEYFIERTKCLVINEHLNHIPPKCTVCIFSYVIMSEKTQKDIVSEIKKAITSCCGEGYAPVLPKYGCRFAKRYWKSTRSWRKTALTMSFWRSPNRSLQYLMTASGMTTGLGIR